MKTKLNELTLVEARRGLQKGYFTPSQLAKSCLDQIQKTQKKLNSFVSICHQSVLLQAKLAEKRLLGSSSREKKKLFLKKPLWGIPIAVKDNYCTKNILTTASSEVLRDFVPPYSATVIERLLNAGAIILGKTNMDAWAHGSSTETSFFGPTRNPHDLSRSAGGSSGGSAAAVASHQTIAAVGTETAGSIRQPAAWCGVVGLKPTYGRVSRWGVIAMASSTDSPGPIAKTVKDAALLLSIIASVDEKDSTTSMLKPEKYHLGLEKVIPSRVTIGVPKEYFLDNMNKEVTRTVREGIARLRKIGFQLKDVSLMDPKYSITTYTIIQRAEVSSNLARYDGIRYGNSRHFFGEEAKRRIMLGTHVLSSGYFDQYYLRAQKVRQLIVDDFKKVFEKVDALVAPTSPWLAAKLGASKESAMFGELQDVLVEASSLAGLPGISIPCGWIGKLPAGMQIIAPQFQEKLILQIAHQFEKESPITK